MKRAFLVDFENVKSAGLVGLEDLSASDEVVILYSVNSNTISFEMHQKIMNSPACVDYYQIKRGGKNSLDFQLSSLLGYLLGSGEYSHLYVVSNDSGFDVLRDFWSSSFIDTDCIVYRRGNLASCLAHSALSERENTGLEVFCEEPLPETDACTKEPFEMEAADTENQQAEEKTEEKFPDTAKKSAAKSDERKQSPQAAFVPAQTIGHGLSQQEQTEIAEILMQAKGKQEFYRKLIAKYGQKKGLETYKILKPDYTGLKNKIAGSGAKQ